MKTLIICDSFKGSLSSAQANAAIAKACERLGIKHKSLAISDGGEGFLECINNKLFANKIVLRLKNASGNRYYDGYYLLKDKSAFFEMAEFAGLAQLQDNEKNPLKTSTHSLGLAISDAIKRGARDFTIGIGGSATNDAGIGMLHALGIKFLDNNANTLEPNGANLINIAKIDDTNKLAVLNECSFSVACDVVNPLYGKMGAAKIYARQKGANDTDIELLDAGLKNFARISERFLGIDYSNFAGAGAAGGLGFGLKAFLNANFVNGFSFIKDFLNLEEEIKSADLIISGEGAFDSQSMMGKLLGQLNMLCNKYNKELLIFCGINKNIFHNCYSLASEYKNLNHNELMQTQTAIKCLEELAFRIMQRKISNS